MIICFCCCLFPVKNSQEHLFLRDYLKKNIFLKFDGGFVITRNHPTGWRSKIRCARSDGTAGTANTDRWGVSHSLKTKDRSDPTEDHSCTVGGILDEL